MSNDSSIERESGQENGPAVTVIVPCFNHGRYLRESLDSILAQSCSDFEVIIIDDCSSDDSWDVIESIAATDERVKAIKHYSNQGVSKSRNDGMDAARGKFVAFCDADDIWEKDKLKLQIALLEENPNFDITYCDALIINEHSAATGRRFNDLYPVPHTPSGRLFPSLIRTNFINMQSVLMRRACVRKELYFDEQIKFGEDWWFWVRLSAEHRFLYFGEPLARYRVHNKSSGLVRRRRLRIDRFKVLRRILRTYPDLSPAERSEVIYAMGAELCMVGKARKGRSLLLGSVKTAMIDWRAILLFLRVTRRLMLRSTEVVDSRLHC